MRPRILAGLGAAGALAFGAFAATGFGNGGGAPAEIATKTVTTHSVAGPPDGVTAAGKRGGLFKITYRSTDPTQVTAGLTEVTVRKCPKGGGVLNAWHLRTGQQEGGVISEGGNPDGLRKWHVVVLNDTSGTVNVKFGLICIK